jgi:hypothetical protein
LAILETIKRKPEGRPAGNSQRIASLTEAAKAADLPDFFADLPDFFADLPLPRARRRVSKSKLRANRLAKRNAVIHALAADQAGTGRAIARALYLELRRYAAGRVSRSADADARAVLQRRFVSLNAGRPLSEGTIRNVLAGTLN